MQIDMSDCSHSRESNRKINFHVLSNTAFLTLNRVDRMQSFTRPSCEVPHGSRSYSLAFLSTVTRWICIIRDVITHSGVAAISSFFFCQFHHFNWKYDVKHIRDLSKHSSCLGNSLPFVKSAKTSAFIKAGVKTFRPYRNTPRSSKPCISHWSSFRHTDFTIT
jgi:hypothetical protein